MNTSAPLGKPAPLTAGGKQQVMEAADAAAMLVKTISKGKENGDGVTPLLAPESGARPQPGSLAERVAKQQAMPKPVQSVSPPPAAERNLAAMAAAALNGG